MSKLNKPFRATLQKGPTKGGWTFVVKANSTEYFGCGGPVKVSCNEFKDYLGKK